MSVAWLYNIHGSSKAYRVPLNVCILIITNLVGEDMSNEKALKVQNPRLCETRYMRGQ